MSSMGLDGKLSGDSNTFVFCLLCAQLMGTCSGTRDLAKRHLGAKQDSFRVKELESLLF